MRRVWMVLVCTSLLLSQSQVPVDQLRVRPGSPSTGVWVFYNGAFVLAEVGEGVQVAVVEGKPVLKVTPAAPKWLMGADLTAQADGSCLLPNVAAGFRNVAVYRNGVRQKQGLDYVLDVQSPRRVVPLFAWAADDVLQADIEY